MQALLGTWTALLLVPQGALAYWNYFKMIGRIELITMLPKAPLRNYQALIQTPDQTRPRVSPSTFLPT